MAAKSVIGANVGAPLPVARGPSRRLETPLDELAVEELHRALGGALPALPLALDEQAFFLGVLLDTIPDNIYFKDASSRFTRISRHMARWLGLADPIEAMGKTDFEFFTSEHAEQAYRDEQDILRTGVPLVNVHEKETFPDGSVRWVSTTKMPLRDPDGNIVGTFGISRDITEYKRIAEQLERHGLYDALTNLPNRALFVNRVEHLFRRAERQAGHTLPFAVLYFDVDRFKGVNDSFGHHAGDDFLVEIARRLERSLRPGDTLARLGGDDFAILLEDLRVGTDATRVAERIQEALVAPISVEGTEVFCSASIGIALAAASYSEPQEMLRDANT